jgi:hypothetical protein
MKNLPNHTSEIHAYEMHACRLRSLALTATTKSLLRSEDSMSALAGALIAIHIQLWPKLLPCYIPWGGGRREG